MGTGVKKEWYLGGGEWTEDDLEGIERRSSKRCDPPANVTDIEAAPGKRGRPSKGTAICKTCRTVFPTTIPQVERRCPDCRMPDKGSGSMKQGDEPARPELPTLPAKACVACGDAFTPTTARNSRCEACRHGAERTATCDECGVTFTYRVDAGKPLQRFCSKSHATRFNKRLRKARQLVKEVAV